MTKSEGNPSASTDKPVGASVANAFGLFLFLSYLVLILALVGIVYDQIQSSNSEVRKHQVAGRVVSFQNEFENVIHSYQSALEGHSHFSLIKQAVMQPEQFSEVIGDFIDQLHLLGGQPQQVLVDFEGNVIYQRHEDPLFDYKTADDVIGVLVHQKKSGFSVNLEPDTDTYYWRVVVPVKYFNNTEGALIAEIPFETISAFLKLEERLARDGMEVRYLDSLVASMGNGIEGESASRNIPKLNLNLTFTLDTKPLLDKERDIFWLLSVVLTVVMLLLGFLSYLLGKRFFVRPLEELSEQTRALARGEIKEVPAVFSNIRELRALAQASRFMSQQVNKRTQVIEQAYQQLRENQAQLVQSEKMASLGFLSAGVAHEINNPSGFVQSNLETLSEYLPTLIQASEQYLFLIDRNKTRLSDTKETVDLKELEYILSDLQPLLEETLDGMGRIQSIVDSMKKFTRPDSSQMVRVDLNEEIKNTLRLVWNELKYTCEVECEYGVLPQISCFPSKLSQVFTNLLVNASQAIEGKGLIKIETQVVGNNVQIIFEDNGAGIPSEIIEQIFEPFYTTKANRKGTGLGLSISSDIINQHGGSIRVDSQVGKGSKFFILLPINKS